MLHLHSVSCGGRCATLAAGCGMSSGEWNKKGKQGGLPIELLLA